MTREERQKRTELEQQAGKRALERNMAQVFVDNECIRMQKKFGVSIQGGAYYNDNGELWVSVTIRNAAVGHAEPLKKFPSDLLITKIMLVA